jgi:hypothetical protein
LGILLFVSPKPLKKSPSGVWNHYHNIVLQWLATSIQYNRKKMTIS